MQPSRHQDFPLEPVCPTGLGAPYHQGVGRPSQAGLEENKSAKAACLPLAGVLAPLPGLDPWVSLGRAPATAGREALTGGGGHLAFPPSSLLQGAFHADPRGSGSGGHRHPCEVSIVFDGKGSLGILWAIRTLSTRNTGSPACQGALPAASSSITDSQPPLAQDQDPGVVLDAFLSSELLIRSGNKSCGSI